MKALIFDEPNKLIVADVQSPSISEHEVMIRSTRVGICHSDYELLSGNYIIPISYPVTPGHEWVGEVVEVGKSVSGLNVGDRVVGECVINTPERIHHFGFSMDGADREYFAARPEWLHKLPDGVDDSKGALIEPFTCGYYAVLRNGGVDASSTVVVSGGGTIGLVSAAAAIGMGARVIVVDPIPLRREIAMKLGADATVDPTDGDPSEAIAEMTKGGADLVVEAAGHSSSLAPGRRCVYGRHQHRSEIPCRTGKDPDQGPDRSRMYRLSWRVAGCHPVLGENGNRPVSDPDPDLQT